MDNPQDLAPTGNGTILSSHALLPSNVFASQMIASLCVFLLGANRSLEKPKEELKSTSTVLKDRTPESVNLHSQATAYERLAESDAVKTGSLKRSAEKENLSDDSGLFAVLPVSAESTGMLPNRKDNHVRNVLGDHFGKGASAPDWAKVVPP
ncbi:hypothetical protein ACE6H2_000272 [Prunus campanulata]